MSRSIEDVKTSVSGKFLGRSGIHGIGIRRSQNALMVYLHAGDEDEQSRLLREIEAEASPYLVLSHVEGRPVLH